MWQILFSIFGLFEILNVCLPRLKTMVMPILTTKGSFCFRKCKLYGFVIYPMQTGRQKRALRRKMGCGEKQVSDPERKQRTEDSVNRKTLNVRMYVFASSIVNKTGDDVCLFSSYLHECFAVLMLKMDIKILTRTEKSNNAIIKCWICFTWKVLLWSIWSFN